MPNIPQVNSVVDEFEAEQRGVIATWTAQEASLAGNTQALQHSASAAMSATATNWERFRSEWHKRAIARDATVFRSHLIRRSESLISAAPDGAKYMTTLRAHGVELDVRLPKHPGLSTVSELLDPGEANITFRTRTDSDAKAHAHLVPDLAAHPLSLDDDDWLVIGVMLGVRNALAHSSAQSMTAMNRAIRRANGGADDDVRALGRLHYDIRRSAIGLYLNRGINRSTRTRIVCEWMLGLGAKFRV